MSEDLNEQTPAPSRPLSPHLQVYRLPYNALMSIIGRMAGIGLALVLILVLSWFIAVVWQPALYDQTMVLLDNPFTKYAFIALAFVIFFYLGNGIRHALWDFGIGVNEKSGIMTGNIVLVLAALLTYGLWELSCGCWFGNASHDVSAEAAILEGAQNAE